jgi:histidinol dehydrogenase
MIATSYRLRNAIREAATASIAEPSVRAHEMSSIDAQVKRVNEQLFDAKALLPLAIGTEFHSIKHYGVEAVRDLAHLPDEPSEDDTSVARRRLDLHYEHIDSSFQRVLQLATKHLDVQVIDSPRPDP